MRGKLLLGLVVLAGVVTAWAAPWTRGEEKDDAGPMIVHNVFFTLKDGSAENRKKLVEACKKLLTRHEGEVFFAAGPLAEAFKAPVNDRDFDVCLTIVFKNKAAHDKYQPHERHQRFIKENKESFKSVRVFDSLTEK